MPGSDARVETIDVAVFRVPTDQPESDGTIEWDSTTIVVVTVRAGGETGIGYTYGSRAVATMIDDVLRRVVTGASCLDVERRWRDMGAALRNAGRPGVGMMALSAIDVALWDAKARLLGVSVTDMLPGARPSVPVYGSGGFCSYTLERLSEQTSGWVQQGIPRVKIKTSRHPGDDPRRLDAVRKAIGDDAELFVDANGALARTQALAWAERFRHEWGVSWFEEPVSSADFEGLRLLRNRAPAGLDVAAGEYAFVPADFRNLLAGGCVDCLQADVTRCGGITGVLHAGGLAEGFGIDLSAHCAPALSAHAFCAVPRVRHLEYFHDHVRVERMLFDGLPQLREGALYPDRSVPGLGLRLKAADAERLRVA